MSHTMGHMLRVNRLSRMVCHWGCLHRGTRWAETTPSSHIVTGTSYIIFYPYTVPVLVLTVINVIRFV